METMVVAVFFAGTSRCTWGFYRWAAAWGSWVFFWWKRKQTCFVMWIKVRACLGDFFPIISGTLHPHLGDYDQLAQPMSACEDLGMQRDEDRHFSSGGKTIGWHYRMVATVDGEFYFKHGEAMQRACVWNERRTKTHIQSTSTEHRGVALRGKSWGYKHRKYADAACEWRPD